MTKAIRRRYFVVVRLTEKSLERFDVSITLIKLRNINFMFLLQIFVLRIYMPLFLLHNLLLLLLKSSLLILKSIVEGDLSGETEPNFLPMRLDNFISFLSLHFVNLVYFYQKLIKFYYYFYQLKSI